MDQVTQGNDGTVELAVQHDRLAADRPRERRAIDLVIPTGDIPLVTNENDALPCGRGGPQCLSNV